jgi:hypothetical protein
MGLSLTMDEMQKVLFTCGVCVVFEVCLGYRFLCSPYALLEGGVGKRHPGE